MKREMNRKIVFFKKIKECDKDVQLIKSPVLHPALTSEIRF